MATKKSSKNKPLRQVAKVLVLATLTVLCGYLSIALLQASHPADFHWEATLPLLAYFLGVPIILIWLKLSRWQGDNGLLGATFLLSGLGLLIQYRMGSFAQGLAAPQGLLAFPLGFFAFLVGHLITAKGRGHKLTHFGYPAYVLTLAIFALMLVLGRRYRGGIYLPGHINPSEIVKPLLVFFLATHLSKRQKAFSETQIGLPAPPLPELLGLALLWSLPLVMTILLKDLGLMALLNATLIIMLFAVGHSIGYLITGLGATVLGGYIIQHLSTHVRARIDVWLHPFSDPTGKSWQILQGLVAMHTGGLWGTGLGAGVPQTVPIVTSDFVYAAIAEEFGLVGCALILIIYLSLFSRALRVAGVVKTPFERLLTIGLTASLATQTILNIAGVTKALPMTGITLPLISHGGSSLITTLLICGMLCGLSDRK